MVTVLLNFCNININMASLPELKEQYATLVRAVDNAHEHWAEQDSKPNSNDLLEKEAQETVLQALKTFHFVRYALDPIDLANNAEGCTRTRGCNELCVPAKAIQPEERFRKRS
jgi:hypothetical protein